jgi:hypothetical protein
VFSPVPGVIVKALDTIGAGTPAVRVSSMS